MKPNPFAKNWLTSALDEMWQSINDDDKADVEERAAIMEFDARFTRKQAERMALAHHFGVAWPDVFRKMRLGDDGCSNQMEMKYAHRNDG